MATARTLQLCSLNYQSVNKAKSIVFAMACYRLLFPLLIKDADGYIVLKTDTLVLIQKGSCRESQHNISRALYFSSAYSRISLQQPSWLLWRGRAVI